MAYQSQRRRRSQSWGLLQLKDNAFVIFIMVIVFFCRSAAGSREVSGYPSDRPSIGAKTTPVAQSISSVNPPQQEQIVNRPLARRGEINPAWKKFRTVPDDDMPGYPEWSVLAKDNLSSWDDETWTLRTTKLMPGMYPTRLGIANGYLGCAVAAAGPFFEMDVNQTNHPGPGSQPTEGWPLWNPRQTFATLSGFYDSQPTTPGSNYPELRELGYESVISGIPHFLGLKLVVGGQVYDAKVDINTVNSFDSNVKFKKGLYGWKLTWSPRVTNISLDIEVVSHVNKARLNVAGTQLRVTPRGGNCTARIIDVFDGRSAVRSYLGEKGLSNNSSMHVSIHPDGQPGVTAWMVSTVNVPDRYTDESSRRLTTGTNGDGNMTIGQQWDIHLVEGETAIFEKFVGIASTDKFPDAETSAREESLRAFKDGWDTIVGEHIKEWNALMAPNLITSYRDPATGRLPENETVLEKLQIAAVADAYYILQNLVPAGSGLDDEGVAVGGLTSDTYGGMRFWDQDFWMFPAILASWPNYARQFLRVRTKHLPQAKLNSQAPYVQDIYKFDNGSAMFPWTSGRFNNATATGPVLNYEYHLNTAIALAAFNYLDVTGDEEYFKAELWPIVNAIGHTISTLLFKDGDGYSINNMTDPDEWANNVKNGAFTLASFSTILTQISNYQETNGLTVNEIWVDMAAKVNIPKAGSGITLEYEGMFNNASVKQADVTLMIYPLNFPNYTLKEQLEDLSYYDGKQSPDGPAMTHAISAIAMNRVASSGCSAFSRQFKAQLSNLRAPWFQMSEQANDDRNANGGVSPGFPFLTGSGGSLQIPLFGYLGITWRRGNVIIRPGLPAPLKHLKVADFHEKGNRFRAIMNSTHTNITRLQVEATGLYDAFKDRPMPLIVERRNATENVIYETAYNITMNETITVENDMYWQQLTIPNNFLQCQPTISKGQYVTGNAPGAATDGEPGTHWQPLTQAPSNITIDTSHVPVQKVVKLTLEWGPRTPKYARVAFTNETDLTSIWDAEVIPLSIQPNHIYGSASTPAIPVVPYQGNSTEQWMYLLPREYWSGKYAILEIEGCQGCGELKLMTLDNGTKIWQDDGLGAFVGEFAAVGETGVDVVKNMNEVTADERLDPKLPD